MYTDKYDLLNKAKDLLKNEVTTISYITWIKSLEIDSVNDNKIVLIALSDMQKDAIYSRLFELFVTTFNFITNKQCEITIITKSEKNQNADQDKTNDIIDANISNNPNYSNSFLDPKCTFDNFVIYNNNKFAQAAAYAVAQAPIKEYNPLYIYGGVGLGKTHLLHAIGNHIIKNDPSKHILYVTSENFINDLINSIKDPNYKKELFRNKYRNIDVLLVDDIQFIAGKKTGQEEFFHTFNTLYQNGKRIIISSDQPPRDIPLLEERLRSRFEGGVLADISVPDYEARLAILRKKVEEENILIDDYILSIIATRIDSNIRELDGSLTKIVAYANLTHSPITIELVEKNLNDYVHQKEKVITADYIQEIVSKYFGINREDLVSKKKSNDIARPRQIAMYICRAYAQMSLTKIGEAFGGKDHTTVMHAVKKIETEIKDNKSNSDTKQIVESVKNIIKDSQ